MFIADLHIHSRYSRATSADCDAPHLDLWARRKGIGLVGTGDFTHPAWRKELREALCEAEPGLYTLRGELALEAGVAGQWPAPRFLVTGEISCIYKREGRVRKVHHLILLPGLDAADELARRLEAVGNIRSDGRPILGLDSRELLQLTLDACPEAVFIPAHIWTPHFAMFGAFSGFDSIQECFGELAGHIHAVETGLSSDPPMNWQVSGLDGCVLVSNSDAHSPAKLGREANLLSCGMNWAAVKKALETGEGLEGTLEFFPEEGKYHLDGHRACGVCLSPGETEQLGGRCPVCGKKITVGVQHRVDALADRPLGAVRPAAKPYESLVPLPEVLAEALGAGPASKKVQRQYLGLLGALGPEFYILRQAPLADIERAAGPAVAEGVRRMRCGQVRRQAGYDGEYGKIGLFAPGEVERLSGQTSFLAPLAAEQAVPSRHAPAKRAPSPAPAVAESPAPQGPLAGLDAEQLAAVTAAGPVVAVVAGPGTGKTRTLVARVEYLLRQGAAPGEVTAVTFTNLAARELRERLEQRLGAQAVKGLTVGTFHSICLQLLGRPALLGEAPALQLAAGLAKKFSLKLAPRKLLGAVSRAKNCPGENPGLAPEVLAAYAQALDETGLLDMDDLLVRALEKAPARSRRFTHLLVDEFQDISPVQYQLVQAWHQAGGGTLFAIGDADQAIYGFRGASAGCFERLAGQGAQVVRLKTNYRSTPQVVQCAAEVIGRNPGGPRPLRAARPGGVPVRLMQADSPFAEAVYIAKAVAEKAGGIDMLSAQAHRAEGRVYAFEEMAVLARTHRQLELIEQCLRRDDIPCMVSGRDAWLEADEVRGALGFFGALAQPGDTLALQAALECVWRLPPAAVQGCLAAWRQGGGEAAGVRAALQAGGWPASWLSEAEQWSPRLREKPLRLLEAWAGARGADTEPMRRLLGAAAFCRTMPQLLQTLALGQEADVRRQNGRAAAGGAVRLMTLHGAKGLEFPLVFLAGLGQGMLPLERQGEHADLEEERRLFFVGLTRARDELVLTVPGQASCFAAELPEKVERLSARALKPQPQAQQLSFF